MRILVSFGAISIKLCSSFAPFIHCAKSMVWYAFAMFFFIDACPLPYIVISEIGISFSRSDLNKIHALPIFHFLVYRFHGIIDFSLP